MSTHPALQQLRAQAKARWQRLAPREQRSVLALAVVVGVLLFWLLALAPALHTLRDNDVRRAQLAQQLAHMQALQAQALALALQTRSAGSREMALSALQSLGSAPSIQIAAQGERVSVQLKAVPAANLASFLEQARLQAQALPMEAHLTRSPNTDAPLWDGSLVLSLPSRATN